MSDLGDAYMQWVREQKCTVCLSPPPSDPHHLISKGAGGGPLVTIPLCRACHRMYHDHGHHTFEQQKGVNLWRLAHRHLRRYLANDPIAK